MHRRLWLAVTMLVTGASLLVAASLASASGSTHVLKKGGIWREGFAGSSSHVDPQVAYDTLSWALEYATAAKLYNYPDKPGPAGSKLVPEVASGFKVSNGGKTYTFTIRKGFRFSDGKPVTANNFKYAINRTANKALGSPGASFITDPAGTNIVGAQKVNAGGANNVSGVTVKGKRLIIHLKAPDGTFMSKITMPFFQATPLSLPLQTETTKGYAGAGPYYYANNAVDRLTSLRLNKYYKKGPGRHRPHNLAGFDVQWNLNTDTAFNQTLAGELDEFGVPAAQVESTRKRFGVNKSRYWVEPINCTGYLPLNNARPLFGSNLKLRKAVNYAVNRRDYVQQAGLDAGAPWTALLNPGVPGWTKKRLYPITPQLTKARSLAKGKTSGKINVWFRSSGTTGPAQYQIVRRDLIQLGFKANNIESKGFSGTDIYDAVGKRGNSADIATGMGWCSDYPDPYDWMNKLFGGNTIQAENNDNWSYLNNPTVNRKLNAAARLTGPKRIKTYSALAVWLVKNVAPIVPERTYNNTYIFSARVNPKSFVYQGIYQDFDIAALAVK
jgi:peptide/nickel transport system substrate-binding protein